MGEIPIPPFGGGDPHQAKCLDGGLLGLTPVHMPVTAEHLVELAAHRHDRVEGSQGVLEDHRHLAAPDVLHFPFR